MYLPNMATGGITAYYNYGAVGERNFKLTSPRLTMYQNAYDFGMPPLVYTTMYASPLVTVDTEVLGYL